ncbi:Putative peptidoglycan binding domain protein [Caballeronia choica]|uniref:Peptidoglycan binding domain protein n=1 Tax=Caballeronia choica TaxID=326476 RepID=A0A158KMX5_9BURK|nr:peptidoglycan-binding domain-containing protein [Caballeronia choica]SAL82487.1 Putative peptidoglycan binding domain protein [Caballeronia choica]
MPDKDHRNIDYEIREQKSPMATLSPRLRAAFMVALAMVIVSALGLVFSHSQPNGEVIMQVRDLASKLEKTNQEIQSLNQTTNTLKTDLSGLEKRLDAASANTQKSNGREETCAVMTTEMLQRKLNTLGYFVGATDGVMGKRTISALSKFQADHHLPVTRIADSATICALAYEK